MKQYALVADNYPAHQTPSVSAISTPEQNTNQRRDYYPRLSALAIVSPAKKLQFLDREMYSELKIKIQAKHVQYGIIPAPITASFNKSDQSSALACMGKSDELVRPAGVPTSLSKAQLGEKLDHQLVKGA